MKVDGRTIPLRLLMPFLLLPFLQISRQEYLAVTA